MDYRQSGVDREEGDRFVEDIRNRVEQKKRSEVLSSLGDFGGFFEAPKNLREPIWVATTDGVGTKLLLAEEAFDSGLNAEAHRHVGQDVVAMCVNDLLACRAEPIIFLDYIATGRINRNALGILIDGIAGACEASGCSLIGGETAEMPGYYPVGRYDVAGFSVGVLEKSRRFNLSLVEAGDRVFGCSSSGFHSNGYSLVRKIMKDQNWRLSDSLEGKPLAETLLVPTELYVKRFLTIDREFELKAASHITGGGLVENLPRGFNEERLRVVLSRKAISTSALMQRFVEASGMPEFEAFSTWNMGIGFCVVVAEKDSLRFQQKYPDWHQIGHIELKSDKAAPSAVIVA